jgi:cytochrome c oxidase subunit 2
MNEFLRRMLFLPEQASTFALDVDHLHYFVIIVTMLASGAVGLVAIGFFWKYRRRRPNQSTPMVNPTAGFEVAVITVPLAIFLVWFFIGFGTS